MEWILSEGRTKLTSNAETIRTNCDDMAGQEVSIAGRIMAFRSHGKSSFADIKDRTGRVQIYARRDILGDENYRRFVDLLDIGDIIGVKGKVFRTKKGEPTVEVEEVGYPVQGVAAVAGKMARAYRCRSALQAEVPGSNSQPRGSRRVRKSAAGSCRSSGAI